MPLSIGRRIEHQGRPLIVGHGGRLYAPRLSVDAWGRTRQTQKVTKYRIIPCGCGRTFIAHDARMKTCEACQAHAQPARHTRRATEAQPSPTTACAQCGQRVVAQRSTRMYCSRACQQKAYRERHQNEPRSAIHRPK
jgi:hypothetical protein